MLWPTRPPRSPAAGTPPRHRSGPSRRRTRCPTAGCETPRLCRHSGEGRPPAERLTCWRCQRSTTLQNAAGRPCVSSAEGWKGLLGRVLPTPVPAGPRSVGSRCPRIKRAILWDPMRWSRFPGEAVEPPALGIFRSLLTWSWAACSEGLSLGGQVGPDDLHRSHATLAVLCDSVIR